MRERISAMSSEGVPHITPGACRAASLVGMPIALAVLRATVSASSALLEIKIEELALISIATAERPAASVSRRSLSTFILSESLLKRAHFAGSTCPVVMLGAMFTISAWRAITSRIFLPEPPMRILGWGFWTGLGKLYALSMRK